MHQSAMFLGESFFKAYLPNQDTVTIVDIGSQDVNGSLRSVAPSHCRYVGVDFADNPGVDIILADPYKIPFPDCSVDACVSSSCLEHCEFFWELFLELMRILKPGGLLYINVPSNGSYHRYPVDCWRFYPDSGLALQNWGRRSGYDCLLLESFVAKQMNDVWNDFVAVYVKDRTLAASYPKRIQDDFRAFANGRRAWTDLIVNKEVTPEDQASLVWKVRKRLKATLGGGIKA